MRLWISACLCPVTFFPTEGKAQNVFSDTPNPYLKGIDAVHYSPTYFAWDANGAVGSRCAMEPPT
jgi:hypothetical protein